ncbi:MAG: UDP-N-acetylglucosamine--N-acetylmuramyl-(pentapeptide) pyrophosphoryl-undecaprenol N-acetylglucosamine transferase [Oscillospiraceae bacterium]|nr:UDP-N-acetylglucosamine--N-acetylmuramyl-(pentapeptide) pyrophosphoryl-undecaprenol N-acetylglucosamine transferase [Oscillospiraceae bacterium]
MKVLLAGGGTGGHVNPALAIAGIIRTHVPDAQFLFAGTPNGMEAKLVPQAGFPLAPIKVAGFQRHLSLENIGRNAKAAWYLAGSGPRARQIIREFSPDIAIGTGGYVAGPVIRMAAKLGIPTAIHEQNAYPGVTNRLLAGRVDHVMLTVKEALEYFGENISYTVTGLPVRAQLLQKTRDEARAELGFDNSFCILSFGGSLGAGCINDTMAEVLRWHTSQGLPINHIHGYGGMGRDTFPQKMEAYGIPMKSSRLRISEYINDMDTCMAAADLVVCRAGAGALAELEALGKPSLLIPSPIVAGNHQYHNAMVLGKAGAAIVIEQKDADAADITGRIEALFRDRDRLSAMAKAAAGLAVPDTDARIWGVIEGLRKKA